MQNIDVAQQWHSMYERLSSKRWKECNIIIVYIFQSMVHCQCYCRRIGPGKWRTNETDFDGIMFTIAGHFFPFVSKENSSELTLEQLTTCVALCWRFFFSFRFLIFSFASYQVKH